MREFRKTTGRGKKPQVWFIGKDRKDPETYVVRWGIIDGAMQETSDRPGSCGVEGHSDFQTPSEYAQFCIDRDIRKKLEQGYVEYVDGKPLTKVATAIDFSKPLPKNLCFYKPQLKIEDKALEKLEAEGRAIWTLKRDGMMHIAVKRNDEWEIYSRRMDLVTDKYPHIIEKLDELDVEDGTILVGEMVLLNADGTDNFKGVSRICRSKTDLALAYQGLGDFPKKHKDEDVLGKIAYYVFDVPFYNGEDMLTDTPTYKRLGTLRDMFSVFGGLKLNTGGASKEDAFLKESKRRERMLREHYIAPLKIYFTSAGDDLELAKELKIEGWVVMDAEGIYGDKGYSFDGKARRPSGIWKRKPAWEDEFIITGTYKGSGKNRDRFGGFLIAQIHPETNEVINCGKCGGGFTDEHRDEFLDDGLINKTIKVKFDSRQPPKNGEYALRFPVFLGFSDKTPEECIAQNLGEEEE
ncbi:MAG: ATP-dependent DNA ligase [bacterium]